MWFRVIYLAILLLTLLFSTLDWEINPEHLKFAALVPLAYVLFTDSIRLRYRPVIKYHALSIALSVCTLAAAAGIGSSLFGTALFVLVVLFDMRGDIGLTKKGLIPPKITQLLSIDGGLRTLLVVFATVIATSSGMQTLTTTIVTGVLFGCLALLILNVVQLQPILFCMPLLGAFGYNEYSYHPLLILLIVGSIIGNFSRMKAKPFLLSMKKIHPYLLGISLIIFTLNFSKTLLLGMSWQILFYSLATLIGYCIFMWTALKVVGMRSESGLFYTIASLPGTGAFSLAVLFVDPSQPLIPCMLANLFIARILLLPKAIEAYGKLFTGRDPYSSLKEHGAVVELPI